MDRSNFLALTLATSALVLSACATTPSERAGLRPAAEAPEAAVVAALADAPPKTDSLYGMFLSGKAAEAGGRNADAALYYSQLAAADLDNADFLKERAFTAALMAGEIGIAAKMAPGPPTEAGLPTASYRLGRLTQAVDALAVGDPADAYKRLTTEDLGATHRVAAAVLAPWAAAAAGDVDNSVALPGTRDPVAAPFAQFSQAVLLERAGKLTDAEKIYKQMAEGENALGAFKVGYGEFLERRGRRGDAAKIYEGLLREVPNDPGVTASLQRAKGRGKAPAIQTPQQGAAQSLFAMAVGLLGQRQTESGYIYLRLALRLDPGRNDALLMVGDYLEQSGDLQGAREAFAKLPPTAPTYFAARTRLAFNYAQDEEPEQALTVARELVKTSPKDPQAQALLADLLNGANQYDEAIKVLNNAIAVQGEQASWRLYYARAISQERSGRWPDAEKDLQKALTLSPNEADILNYLGYTWADRGERLPEALTMLLRANRANPASGAIIDSLGWVYYKMGEYPRALGLLERAVTAAPGDPDVNSHLGDVYWRVGRKVEAQFQWTRVLSLNPNPKLKAEAEEKLKSGLPPAPPAPPATPATTASVAGA